MDYKMKVSFEDISDIPVIIEYKNNKNVYMRITDNLEILVTCHKRIKDKEIINIIKKNEKALLKMYKHKQEELDKDVYFYYLGKQYVVTYNKSIKDCYFEDDILFAKDEKALAKFWQNECFRVFSTELEKYEPYFSYLPKFSLRVRKMKTRWGVCNRGNNTVTLNSELLKKDISLIDYVVVHELSHFKEANHSALFWHEVELRYPEYKEARKRLRTE